MGESILDWTHRSMELEQTKKKRKSADNGDKEIEDVSKKVKTLLAEKSRPESQEVPEELLQMRVENINLKCTTAEIQSQKAKAKAEKAEKASDQTPKNSGFASNVQENIEPQSGCEFCGH